MLWHQAYLLPLLFPLQTLADPDKRAAYDELAGFAAASINPFLDTSFNADQVRGACAGICIDW